MLPGVYQESSLIVQYQYQEDLMTSLPAATVIGFPIDILACFGSFTKYQSTRLNVLVKHLLDYEVSV